MDMLNGMVRVSGGTGTSLEDIARNPAISEEEKEAEALRRFEGILIREVLRDTMEAMTSTGIEGNKTATAIYGQWMTDQLVDSITSDGGLGIAQTMREALRLQNARSDAAPVEPELNGNMGGNE